MDGRRLQIGLAVAVAVGTMAAPSSASGAITIGETFVPTGACSPETTFLQSASPGSTYAVPSSGVLTSWSFRAAAEPPPIRLKVGNRVSGDSFQLDAHSEFKTPVPNVLNTYPDIRIPVAAGDVIGFALGPSASTVFCARVLMGYDLHYRVGDEPPGPAQVYTQDDPDAQLDISAVLESDADGDGFGDESQDECPAEAGPVDGCPTSPPPPPADTDPPETTITKGAPNRTEKHKVKFKFRANEDGSTFECKKDRKPWKACSSPTKMKRLDQGKHKFKVRATDAAGNTGKPAKDRFKVVG